MEKKRNQYGNMQETKLKYTLDFIFDKNWEKVLLVHKQRPEWQKGKINGVGGKYEEGENSVACIRRETNEKTGLDIEERTWISMGGLVPTVA